MPLNNLFSWIGGILALWVLYAIVDWFAFATAQRKFLDKRVRRLVWAGRGMKFLGWCLWGICMLTIWAMGAGQELGIPAYTGPRPHTLVAWLLVGGTFVAGFFLTLYPPFLGRTQLMKAVIAGKVELVQRLLLNDVDINDRAVDGRTALMWAVQNGNLDLVLALLQAGADPNIRLLSGATALHLAAEMGNGEIAAALLEHEAKRKLKDLDGNTALDVARTFHQNAVVALLSENDGLGTK